MEQKLFNLKKLVVSGILALKYIVIALLELDRCQRPQICSSSELERSMVKYSGPLDAT